MANHRAQTPREIGELTAVLRGLLHRLRLDWLLRHHDRAPVLAIYTFISVCASIVLIAILALITQEPLIFPALGATAFLFFYTPTAPSAAPRNTLIGHSLAIICGFGSVFVTGLLTHPAAVSSLSWRRIVAVGLALGCTTALMILCHAPHPPAGSTALLIALGILPRLTSVVALLVGIALLIAQAIIINRLAGVAYPLWNPPTQRCVSQLAPTHPGYDAERRG